MGESTVIIGVGNPDRGDDGVGIVVAAIAGSLTGVAVRTVNDPFDILDAWGFADRAVVIDATKGTSAPGVVTVFDVGAQPFPPAFPSSSSHGLGIADAVALGKALGRLPKHLVVIGVEGEVFDGCGLSAAVSAAVDAAVGAVLEVMCDA
ncbi:MAG TPA: hydrogenase maturation protease [Acidimicrobiia bacterium]|nr:hydrogenase maturation protease [Acidimicrobiia bacterium]